MKLLKILTIVLFSLILSFSVLYAQENNAAGSGVTGQQQNDNSGNVSGSEAEKAVSDGDSSKSDSSGNKKVSAGENKSESTKAGSKKNSARKEIPVSGDVKEESTEQVRMEGDLLLINEGNFKYKRIPDIKLADLKPQSVETGSQAADAQKPGQNKPTGFLGLSKTASDIIVKGGVLLFILLIFVLYKSRMSHPGRKSSKRRNVLNSYRK